MEESEDERRGGDDDDEKKKVDVDASDEYVKPQGTRPN